MDAPEILYKYRSWTNSLHKRILSHREIFFTSPRHFNDPFDCKIPFDMLQTPRDELKAAGKRVVRKDYPYLARKDRRDLEKKKWREFKRNRHSIDFQEYTRNDLLDSLENTFGVLSLTKDNDDILMWSHYADCHRGFCVGFDFKQLFAFVKKATKKPVELFPVDYRSEYPLLKLSSNEHPIETLNRMLTIKAKDWEYENEYRLIVNGKVDFSVSLPEDVINTVIVGAHMNDKDYNELSETLARFEKKPRVLRASTERKKFALRFA